MAIQKPDQPITYTLREEIASRVMLLHRDVSPDCSVSFYGTIYPESITYELDSESAKIGLYERRELPQVTIGQAELMTLYAIPVTLADGTTTYIGEILANFADQLIAKAIGKADEDIITTQHIEMPIT